MLSLTNPKDLAEYVPDYTFSDDSDETFRVNINNIKNCSPTSSLCSFNDLIEELIGEDFGCDGPEIKSDPDRTALFVSSFVALDQPSIKYVEGVKSAAITAPNSHYANFTFNHTSFPRPLALKKTSKKRKFDDVFKELEILADVVSDMEKQFDMQVN